MLESGRNTQFPVIGSSNGWFQVGLTKGDGWIPETDVGVAVKEEDGDFCVEIDLESAWKLGAIKGSFVGNGTSSGMSITLKAKSNLTLSICPTLRPGTKLRNGNAQGQDMVLRRPVRWTDEGFVEVKLHFEANVELEHEIEAYCLNFDKANPEASDSMTIDGQVLEGLRKALVAPGHDNAVVALQIATWAITDDVSTDDLRKKNYPHDEEYLVEARQILTQAGLTPEKYRVFR